MGKASSAKKVAKAARAGGRSSGGRQRQLLFPAVLVGTVLAGSGLVFYARTEYRDSSVNVAPTIGDHWHAAYGIYICDEFVGAVDDAPHRRGIHSHGDELIHVHPTGRGASGERARTEVFLEDSPLLDIDADEIKVGDQTWRAGEDTCEVDGEEVEAEIVLAQWDDVLADADPVLVDIEEHRFRGDGEGYVFAFVPEGETDDIPKPQSVNTLSEVSGRGLESQIDPNEIDPNDLPDGMSREELEEILGQDAANPEDPDADNGDQNPEADGGDEAEDPADPDSPDTDSPDAEDESSG